jgi:hypothetical protein
MKYFISRKISFPSEGYEFIIKFVFVISRCSRGGLLNVEPYFVYSSSQCHNQLAWV